MRTHCNYFFATLSPDRKFMVWEQKGTAMDMTTVHGMTGRQVED